LYDNDEERKRFMSAYVSSGIGEREAVTYLADDAPDALERTIEALGIAKPSEEQWDQFIVASAVRTYCPDGQFIPQTMLDHLRDMYALRPAGCEGARMTAEMTWALRGIPGSDRLIEYEGRINNLLKTCPLITLCQYDTRKFNGAAIFDILNVHPIMIVHGQIMRNPFYVVPDQDSEVESGAREGK
jgi:hypothetical protein